MSPGQSNSVASSFMHPAIAQLAQQFTPSPLCQVEDELLTKQHLELWLKRDDLLHPIISGNKWRKLKYTLDHALSIGADTLISMGGAYSNHLHALAYVGKLLGIKTIGYVRGEPGDELTPTLRDVQSWGMELRFVSRTDYRALRHYRQHQDLPGILPNQYWLPEGGAQTLVLQGLAEMVTEIETAYDVICTPCGTGATLAGIIAAVPEDKQVLGFAALKNADFLFKDVENLLTGSNKHWDINLAYHFGGFANVNPELLSFIDGLSLNTKIPFEPVYTGKMMYGLFDLIRKHYFQPGQRIIAVHTGGLQGNRGFK